MAGIQVKLLQSIGQAGECLAVFAEEVRQKLQPLEEGIFLC